MMIKIIEESGKRDVLLLLTPLGQEQILRLLFRHYALPTLLDLSQNIPADARQATCTNNSYYHRINCYCANKSFRIMAFLHCST